MIWYKLIKNRQKRYLLIVHRVKEKRFHEEWKKIGIYFKGYDKHELFNKTLGT